MTLPTTKQQPSITPENARVLVGGIPVYRGVRLYGVARVSDEDFADLVMWRWTHAGGYPCRWDSDLRRAVYMHREVMGLVNGDGLEVDHINGDPLDNRRENLRLATRSQQGQNTRKRAGTASKYRGVTRSSDGRRWKAQGKNAGRTIYLGQFETEEEASAVYEAFRVENYTHARA